MTRAAPSGKSPISGTEARGRSGSASAAQTPDGPSIDDIRSGDRRALAKTFTLLESSRADRAQRGRAVLEKLMPHTGGAARVGITGPSGVGKSTFVEALGLHLIENGMRVAVLAVDPSSPVTGGSILGDKTRMDRLAQSDRAFIRPSPSGAALGGVGQRTRESMLVCEAAGFDVILVETVGIGQSEIAVRSMVDFFLVLLQPGAGDDLQGIKKGVLELADGLVVNKADGDQEAAARRTKASHVSALGLLRAPSTAWKAPVLEVSALQHRGIDEVWQTIQDHRAVLFETGELDRRRREQARDWLWSLVEEGLQREFRTHPSVATRVDDIVAAVERFETAPSAAAAELLEAFRKG